MVASPLSIAEDPASSAIVWVGPPLSASGPRAESSNESLGQLLQPLASVMLFIPVGTPKQLSAVLLAIMVLAIELIVPSLWMPPPVPVDELLIIVVLTILLIVPML